MGEKSKFQKWAKRFVGVMEDEIAKWLNNNNFTKENMPKKLPEGFEEQLLIQYLAYRSERYNKQLVYATWGLAIGTLILSALTLYFQYSN